MSWKTTFDGQYGAYDSQLVPCPTGGAPGALPKPRGKLNGNAEVIQIQAHWANPGTIVVGQDVALAADGSKGGTGLAPGGVIVLPDNQYTKWKHIASVAGCSFIVTYVAGPK